MTIDIIESDRLSYAGKALSMEMVIGFRIIGHVRARARVSLFFICISMYSIFCTS